MNTIAIIVSLIALVGAGFAFLRASSSHRIMTKRVEKQKDRIDILEERLRKLEGNAPRGRRNTDEAQEEGRRNQPRQERHEQQEQRHEERQKQRSKKSRPERQPQDRTQQDEQPQERQPQERQQERRQREKQSPDMPQQSQQRQPEDRSERHTQQPQQEEGQQQRRPKRENRRRNEPRDTSHSLEGEQERGISSTPVNLEIVGGNLLDELEQEAANSNSIPAATSVPIAADAPIPSESPAHSGKAYAIIPEDGLIRQHQLQQQPDSDSYIEVDVPKEGGNMTYYRFNLAGNHAFVISQGIDRLENAFSFEKPSNRMVSQVVQQNDGVLTRVGNGWKIEQKARIDFR